MKNDYRMYNLLLPIWLIIFVPTWLWLLLIPANYLLDRIVLRWSLGDMPDKGLFCRRHNWKICLAGFVSDFVGALLLIVFTFGLGMLTESGGPEFLEDAIGAVMMNPFANILALIVTLAAVCVAGVCIYFLDIGILKRVGLDASQAHRSAIRLALITAPYVYLFPSQLLYNGV